MDLKLSKDEHESYRIFQGRIVDEYESMVDPEGFTVIDGPMDIEKQQNTVRKLVLKSLGNKKAFLGGGTLQEGNDIKVVTRNEIKAANQQKQ